MRGLVVRWGDRWMYAVGGTMESPSLVEITPGRAFRYLRQGFMLQVEGGSSSDGRPVRVAGLLGAYRAIPVGAALVPPPVGMGDVICSQAEGDAGVRAVGELVSLWQAAGSPAKYKPAVQALVDAGQVELKNASAATVAVQAYCNLKDIGQRAAALTARIATEYNMQAPPVDPALADGSTSTLTKILAFLTLSGSIALAVHLWEQHQKKR